MNDCSLFGILGCEKLLRLCRRGVATAVCAAAVSSTGTAQDFQNLNFESIGAPSIAPDGIWLAWRLGAPGWRHALGGDSVFVYHNTPPQSHIGQYYFLADSASTRWSPLEGDYSMVLVSGHYNRADAMSPWVNAFLEQDGLVPAEAKSFSMLASGAFSLKFNGAPVPLTPLGNNRFAGDISAYAGQFVTLTLENSSRELQMPLIVDALGFSPQIVPEPSAAALMLLLGAGLWLRRRD